MMWVGCRCNNLIWVEWRWRGLQPVPVFYDAEGEEITRCPECGAALGCAWLRERMEAEEEKRRVQ